MGKADLFFGKGLHTQQAKLICLGCGVKKECLDFAVSNKEEFGIWGGTGQRDLRKLRRKEVSK